TAVLYFSPSNVLFLTRRLIKRLLALAPFSFSDRYATATPKAKIERFNAFFLDKKLKNEDLRRKTTLKLRKTSAKMAFSF
ncbi:MAG: hypothetical protein IJN32_06655, partial [Thermoguttaceae bacterium]|nr:hypothetical protein [Thermoguttaceae bacterium]